MSSLEAPLPKPKKRFLNVFLLAMLNLAIMASLRNLPLVAEYGLGAMFLYFLVAIFFLFPVALVSAELATGWSKVGGIYIWVREAFNSRWGFFAIWLQWVHNVTWYPAILSFVATTIAYAFSPELAENKFYVFAVVLVGFWIMTFVNYFGLKASTWFSSIGVIIGTLIPGIFILGLGVHWIAIGKPLYINFTWDALIPEMHHIDNLVFLAGMFLAFGGLEVSAVHAKEVKNPQKDYPRAILLAAGIAFLVLTLGSLSISILIPKQQISLVAGLMAAFKIFLSNVGIEYLLVPIALMITIGAIAEVNAWIIGPVRGLYATAKHGDLPPIFQKVNKNNVPFNLLIFQGLIVTGTTFVILFMPSTSSAFWILSAMSAQLYLLMYIFMFLAAIRLRYTHPNVIRSYRISKKHHGMWLIASTGAISSILALLISFIPPSQLYTGNIWFYEGFLIIGIIVNCIIPLVIYQFKKPQWHQYHKSIMERVNHHDKNQPKG